MKELQPGEQPQIPPHWNFIEKGHDGLRVEQIDLDERFLAHSVPDGEDIGPEFNRNNYFADYYFDKKGEIIQFRGHIQNYTAIQLIKGETRVNLRIYEEVAGLRLASLTLSESTQESTDSIGQDNVFAIAEFDLDSDKKDGKNYLRTVTLGPVFDRDGKTGQIIKSLHSTLEKVDGRDFWSCMFKGESVKSWPTFKISYEVENGILIISETQLSTQRTRVLRVPTVLEMDKIAAAVFAKPKYPYKTRREIDPEIQAMTDEELESLERDLKGILDVPQLAVPWKNLDKLIGVSLTFPRPASHGPQNQDETEGDLI